MLIVDDDLANRRILQLTFEGKGYEVLTAPGVAEAQAILAASHATLSLVLSDIQMPVLTGFDLVRWMKSQGMDELPILLITSVLPEPEHRIHGLSLGAVDYLLRSLDPEELTARVANAIEHFQRLKALRASLDDTEALAQAGRLMAATNHEMRNLAQVVDATAGILARKLPDHLMSDHPELTDALAALRHAAGTLAEVTQSMAGLVAARQDAPQPLDLVPFLQDVATMMRPLLKGVAFSLEPWPESALWVWALRTPLKQILVNLLLNARASVREAQSREGGRISLAVRRDPQAGCVAIVVTDNGVGFAEAGTRTEFPAFASTRTLRGGKGLGLWLGHRFATAMGGRLALTSAGPARGVQADVQLRAAPPGVTIDVSSYLSDDFP